MIPSLILLGLPALLPNLLGCLAKSVEELTVVANLWLDTGSSTRHQNTGASTADKPSIAEMCAQDMSNPIRSSQTLDLRPFTIRLVVLLTIGTILLALV